MKRPFLRELSSIGLLAAFAIFIYAPLLFFSKVFFGEEQIGFYYAISDYVRQSLETNTSLLWQSGYFGGVSASLDQFVGAWYPFNLFLFSFFDTFTAHHLSILVATALGLIFTYLFGRLEGWHRSSALILALGYFSATTFMWIQIGTLAAHSFMVLPALLVALRYSSVREHRILAVVAGGLALGVGFLAGFMQIVFYVFVLAGCYALFLDWSAYAPGAKWWRSFPVSLSYAVMTLTGLLLGFRQFFPSAYLIDETIRTNTYATQHTVYPWVTELIAFVMPPYLSVPFVGGGGSAGFYVGTLGLVFALLGLIYYRTRTSLFFAGCYAIVLAFAFHLPLFGWLNEHIPPFSHMGGNFRWMVAGAFPLAYVAAAGVEGFLQAPQRLGTNIHTRLLWVLSLLLAALISLGVTVAVLSSALLSSPERLSSIINWYGRIKTLAYDHEHYMQVLSLSIQQLASVFSITSPRFLFGIVAWVVALAFFATWKYPIVRRHAGALLVLGTIFVSGGTVALQWNELVPQSIYARTPALVELLRARGEDPHSYRFMGYLVGDGVFHQLTSKRSLTFEESTILQHDILTNNTNLFFGLERMDGMEPYRTLRANRLLNTVLAHDTAAYVFDDASPALETSALTALYNRDVQKRVSIEEKLADLKKRVPLLSMMNVEYLYSPYRLDAKLTLIDQLPLSVSTTTKLYVYKNDKVLPRLYFAREAKFVHSEGHEALRRVVGEQDFAARTWIECATCTVSRSSGSVDIVSYHPGEVEVQTKSDTGGWLVFSESYVPGWEVRVDGEPATLYPANYLFQAVYVGPGSHTVSFIYEDVTVVQLKSLLQR